MEWWKGSPETSPPDPETDHRRLENRVIPACEPGSSLLETTTPAPKQSTQDHKTVSSRPVGSSPKRVAVWWDEMTRDPVPWGGKVRLPQRPEVSSKQPTPSPLPNRLRQPQPETAPKNTNPRQSATFIRVYLREPCDPGSSLLEKDKHLR